MRRQARTGRVMLVAIATFAATLPMTLIARQPAEAVLVTSFTPASFSTNDTGAIDIIANTLMTCPGSCAAIQNGTSPGSNNDYAMVLIDQDGTAGAGAATTNSSMANFAMPVGSTVLWAGLYWGAYSTSTAKNQLSFRPPNSAAYQTVTGTVIGTFGSAYHSFANVTSLVTAGGSGNYWAGNIRAQTGGGLFGGWSLVVAYRNFALPMRNLTVFDGYGVVQNTTADRILDLDVSGFLTPPFGSVNAEVGAVVYEGDGPYSGDQLLLSNNGSLTAPKFTALSNAANPVDNVFNSSISDNGVTATGGNPNYVNQLGMDVDEFSTVGVLPNNSTQARIRLTTAGDAFYPGVVTFAVDLYAPSFPSPVKSVVDLNGGLVEPGDTLEYALAFKNTGLDPALNSIVKDVVPTNTTFVPGSIIVDGVAQTDAVNSSAADQGDYLAASRTVVGRLGAGATSINGGTLNPDAVGSLKFRVTVDSAAAGTTVDNTATLDYKAQTIGKDFAYTTNSTNTPVEPRADLVVTKSGTPDPVIAGTNVTWTVNVTNNGPNAAQRVVVEDSLPAGMTLVSASWAAGACSGATLISCELGIVDNASTVPVTIVATAQSTLAPGTVLANRASSTSSTVDLVPGNEAGNAAVTVVTRADLRVSKTIGASPIIAGEPVTYTVTVTNDGPSVADGATVTDSLPSGLALTSLTSTLGSCTLTSSRCDFGSLAVGQSAVVTVVTAVDPSVTASVTNVAKASATTTDPALDNNEASVTTAVSPRADVTVVKTTETAPVIAGQPIRWRVVVRNVGSSTAQSVVLTDAMPVGVSAISASATQGTCNGLLTCNLGSLGPGASTTITIDGVVAAATTGTLTNSVAVATTTPEPASGGAPNSAVVSNFVTALADLKISKSATPQTFVAGAAGTYTITVINNGPSNSGILSVSDPLPTDFVPGTPTTTGGGSCSLAVSVVNCDYAGLAVGESVTITVPGTVNAGAGSLSNNVANVTSSTDPDGSNNSASVSTSLVAIADVSLDKEWVASTADAGTVVNFTLAVRNLGPSNTASGMTVTDSVPSGTTLGGPLPFGCTADVSLTLLSCVLGPIPAATTATLSIPVLINAAQSVGTITNTAQVSVLVEDPNPSNNSDSDSIAVTRRANVTIIKDAVAPIVSAGDNATFNVTVTNSGPSTAESVTFSDPVPTGLSLVAPLPAGCTESGRVLTCTLGTMPTTGPGASVTVSYQSRVDPAVPDGTIIVNTATTSTPTPGSSPASDGAILTVHSRADLGLDKVVTPTTVTAGQPLTWTMTVTNGGPSIAQNVLLTDVLPAGFVVGQVTPSVGNCASTTSFPCSLASLAPGSSFTVTVTGTVNSSYSNAAMANSATVSSSTAEPVGATLSNTDEATAVVNRLADLVLTKDVNPSVIAAGDGPVTYTITVDNRGPSDAVNTVVSDVLPANFVVDSVSPTPACGLASGTVTCDFGTLSPASATEVITIIGSLSQETPSGPLDNTASVTSGTPVRNPDDDLDTATLNVTQRADLWIIKNGQPDPVAAGAEVTYVVAIGNAGPSPATMVGFDDTLPPEIDPATAVITPGAPACVLTGASIHCELAATLAPGAQQSVTIRAKARSNLSAGQDVVSNTATITTATFDSNTADNSSTIALDVVTVADLAVTKSVSPNLVAGLGAQWTITVSNAGPSDALAVSIADVLSPDILGVTVTPSQGNCTAFPCGLGTIVAGSSATIVVDGTIDPAYMGESIRNTARASSTTFDPLPGNDAETVTGPVARRADVSIVKTDSPDPGAVVAGENITYTLAAVNAGPSVARGVSISDSLPSGVDPVLPLPAGCTLTSGVVSCVLGDLAVSAVAVTRTFAVTTVATLPSGSVVGNTATLASTTNDPNSANNVSSATTPIESAADLRITKAAVLAPFVPGMPASWDISVINDGPSLARSVSVNDPVPAGFTATGYVASPGVTCAIGAIIRCDFGDLPVSAIPATVRITGDLDPGMTGTIGNTATVTAATTDPATANNAATATAALAALADVTITKSVVTDPVVPGAPVRFRLLVRNLGPSAAAGVDVTDVLPAGLTFVAASTTSGSCSTLTAVCSLGVVPPNAAPLPAIEILVDALVATDRTGSLTNNASVTTTTVEPAGGGAANTASATATYTPNADVRVTKVGPNVPITSGTSVGFTITVANDGPSDAAAVQIVDTVPGQIVGAVLTANEPGGTCTGTTCTWAMIPAGGTRTVSVTGTIAPGAIATDPNTVVASASTPDPVSNNNGASADVDTIARADISLDKIGPATAVAGNTVVYTLTVSNAGPSDAVATQVADQLPAGLTMISVSSSQGDCSALPCNLGTLGAPIGVVPTTATVTVTAQLDAALSAGPITNRAEVTSTTADDDPSDNRDTFVTEVTRLTDIAIVKSPVAAAGTAGQQIAYDITVTNPIGPSTAESVSISDTLPSGTSFVSAVTTAGSANCQHNAGLLGCSLGTLGVGGSATVRLTLDVAATVADATTISNTATVSTVTPQSNSADDSSQADVTIGRLVDLELVKSVAPPAVKAGEPVTWTVVVTNRGPSQATGVDVVDTLPVGFSIVSVTDSLGGCSASGQTLDCSEQILDHTATWTVSVTGFVDSSTPPGPLTNSATATKTEADPVVGVFPDTDEATVAVTALADVRVTKTAAPDPVVAGDELTWTIRIRNLGPSDAQEISVTDSIPDGLITAPTVTGACAALPCVIATLAANSETTITVLGTVQPSYVGDAIINSASVSSPTDPTPATAVVTSAVIARADLSLIKTVDPAGEVLAGDLIAWTLSVANSGSSDAINTVVTDVLPIALLEDIDAPGCTIDNASGVVSCVIGSVIADGGVSRTITARVKASVTAAQLTNTASVASDTTDVDLVDQTTAVTTPVETVAELSISKSGSDAVAGELTTWTISVANQGPSDSQATTVTDVLPDGLLDIEVLDPLTGCSAASGTLSCDLGVVPTAGTSIVRLRGSVDPAFDPGSMVNTASVSSATTDPGALSNSAIGEIAVSSEADVSIIKSGPTESVPGVTNATSYTITVHNAGPSEARDVSVVDAAPAGMTFNSILSSQGACATLPCALGTVAPGAQATITVVATIDPDQRAAITNSATVTTTTPDPATGNNQSSVETTMTPRADMAIAKTASPEPVVAGQAVNYTIQATNLGPSLAGSVTIADPLPSGVEIAGSLPPGCTESLRIVSCDLGDLAPAAVVERMITVTASRSLSFGSIVTNTATVATSTIDPISENDRSTAATTIDTKADLHITKVAVDGPFVPGTSATWAVTVTNDGPSIARSVTVTDNAPIGFTPRSYTAPPGVSCSISTTVSCTLGDLAVDATPVVINISGSVDESTTGVLTNAATLGSSTSDPDLADNTATGSAAVAPLADLMIVKRIVTSPVVPGRPVRFELEVRNIGPSTAVNVVATDSLPAGLTFQGATTTAGSCSFVASELSCALGDITPNPSPSAPIKIVIDALAAANQFGSLSNSASVTTTTPEGGADPSPNTTTTAAPYAPSADLRVTKLAPNVPVVAGTTVSYTVTVHNDGPSDARTVSLVDTLPSQITAVSVSPAVGSTDGSCTGLTCAWPLLAAGGSRSVVITGTINPGVTATDPNSVSVSAATGDPDASNNTARADVDTVTRADLSIEKSGPAAVTAGDLASYTIVVRNAGPSDAVNVAVTDLLPTGLVPQSATPTGANCVVGSGGNPQRVTCSIGTMAAPAAVGSPTTMTITIVARVVSTHVAGPVTNTATLTTDTPDDDPSNNTDTATTSIERLTNIATTKTPVAATGVVGEQISYDVTVTNPVGPSSAEGVVIADPLPSGTRFVSAVVRSGTASCGESGGSVSCSLGTMLPGATTSVRITLIVDSTVADATGVINRASSSTVTPQSATDDDGDDAAVTVSRRSDLGVTKTVAPSTLNSGEPGTWTIAITNHGPSDAEAVDVVDSIPTDFIVSAISDSFGVCAPTGSVLDCAPHDLAAGATWTITIAGRVDPTFRGTSIANAATVSAQTPEPAGATAANSDDAVMTTEQLADLVVRKVATPHPVVAGEMVTWTISIDNHGPSDATNVNVTDPMPAGIVGTPVVSGACSALPCVIPTIAAATTATIRIAAMVAANFAQPTVSNTVSVTSVTDPTTKTTTSTSGVRRIADLSLLKTAEPSLAVAGEPISWTLTVRNDGSSDADNVQITDELPIGSLTNVVVPSGCTLAAPAGIVSCTKAVLAAGTSADFVINATVVASDTGASIVNTAFVTSATDDRDDADQRSTLTTPLVQQADLELSKTGLAATAGSMTKWTITATNRGPSDAQNVRLTDLLPEEFLTPRVLTPSTGCLILGGELECVFDTLATGATLTVIVEGTIDSTFGPGPMDNTASVASDTTDPNGSTNSDTATIDIDGAADVSLVKDGPTKVVPGQPIEWTITVHNAGPSEARNVTVADLIPPSVSSIVVSPSQGVCTSLPCVLGTLPANHEATIRVQGIVAAGTLGDVVNSATATTSTPDPAMADNTGSSTTSTTPLADVSIAKSAPTTMTAGQTATYELSVVNAGPSTARSVTISDPLPAGTAIAGSLPSMCTLIGTTLSCELGDLVPSPDPVVRSFTITANSNLPAGATIVNAASVVSSTADPAVGDNWSSVETSVETIADIVVSKVALDEPFVPGQQARWQITVGNPTGPSTARSVQLDDRMPDGFTPTSFTSSEPSTTCTLGPLVSCELGDIAAGAAPIVITITGDLAADVGNGSPTMISNSATASSTTIDDDLADNVATTDADVVPLSDVSIAKRVITEPVVPGEPIRFELAVRNGGPSSATGVVVTDQLPPGLTFVNASSGVGNCSQSPVGTVRCELGDVPPNPSPAAAIHIFVDTTSDPGMTGTLSNSASVTTSTAQPDSGGQPDSATVTEPLQPSSDVRVTKQGPLVSPVTAGTAVEYTITVTNDGPSTAVNVALVDQLPGQLINASASPTPACTLVSAQVDCAWTTIPSGESRVATISAVVDATATTIDTNTAVVTLDTPDPDLSSNTSTADVDTTTVADLVLDKSGPATVIAGNTATYLVTTTNNGPSAAVNPVVVDVLPAGLVPQTASSPDCLISGQTVTCRPATLIPAAVVTYEITALVSQDMGSGSVTNRAAVSSDTPDDQPDNNRDTVVTVVTRQADLRVVKTAPAASGIAGKQVRYDIVVTNPSGPSSAEFVAISDRIPAGTSFVSATVSPIGGGACGDIDGLVSCDLGTVRTGEEITLRITLEVDSGVAHGALVTNSASGSTVTPQLNETDDSDDAAIEIARHADLGITKSAFPAAVAAGNNARWQIVVTNAGPSDATNVAVTDSFPAGFSASAITDTRGACEHGGAALDCAPQSLAAGSSWTITVDGSINADFADNLITNSATVSAAEAEPSDASLANSDFADITVDQLADVTIAKSTSPDPVVAGERITWTITTRNDGPSDAQDVEIGDELPAGLVAGSVVVDGAGCAALPCTLPTLAAGHSVVVTVSALVSPTNVMSTLTNRATVSSPNDSSSGVVVATSAVERLADLSLTKTASPATLIAGEIVTWTLVVRNDGSSDASNVVLTDSLPLEAVSDVSASGCAGPTLTGEVTCELGTLGAGETRTFVVTARVRSGQLSNSVTNAASVSSSTPDRDVHDGTAVTVTPLDRQADLSITKTGLAAVAGTDTVWTIAVANAGPSDAQAVTVSDHLPAVLLDAFVLEPFSGCSIIGQQLDCALGDITSGGSAEIRLRTRVASDTTATSIENSAAVSSSTPDPSTGSNVAVASIAISSTADLAVSKSGPSNAVPGVTNGIQWVITVINRGPSAAREVTVNDIVPASVAVTSVRPSQGACTALPCDLGTIAATGSATVTITGTVASGELAPLENSASVTSTTPEMTPGDESSTSTTALSPAAALTVSKSGPATVIAGEPISWTIAVRNDGPSVARGVRLTDVLPTGLSGTPVVEGDCAALPCDLGDIEPGATRNVSVAAAVSSAHLTTLTNSASVTSATPAAPGDDRSDTTSTLTTTSADLTIAKHGSVTVIPGVVGGATWTITVTNAGPSDALGVSVADLVPAGITVVSIVPSQGTCTAFPCLLGGIANGETATIEVVGTLAAGADPASIIENTATVSATTSDPSHGGESSTAYSELDPRSELVVSKVGAPRVIAGQPTQWTITVANTGPSTARGVILNDTLPTWAEAPIEVSGDCDSVPCLLGDIVSGAERTVIVSAVVSTGATGTLSNSAGITTPTPTPQGRPGNPEDVAESAIDTEASLVVDKSGPTSAIPGSPITWEIEVRNLGPSVARSVILDDPMPSGVTPGATVAGACAALPCDLGDLASGDSRRVVIVGTVDPAHGGPITNVATVASITPGGAEDNRSSSTTTALVASADLSLVKAIEEDLAPSSISPSELRWGTNVSYLLTVQNQGPSTAAEVTITDYLPSGLAFVSASVGGRPCAIADDQSVSCPVGSIAPNTSIVANVIAKVVGNGLVENSAVVSAPTPDPDTSDRAASSRRTIVRLANLKVAKTGATVAGDTSLISYSITAENSGPDEAVDVVVQEILPPGLVLVSTTTEIGNYDRTTNRWHLGTMASGVTSTMVLLTSAISAGTYLNRVAISGSVRDTDSTSDTSASSVVSAGGQIPVTGSNPWLFVNLGGAFVVVGAVLSRSTRRRRATVKA